MGKLKIRFNLLDNLGSQEVAEGALQAGLLLSCRLLAKYLEAVVSSYSWCGQKGSAHCETVGEQPASAADAWGEGSQHLSPFLLGLMPPPRLPVESSCDVLLGGSHPPPEAGVPRAFAGKVSFP